jgi:hypothetical protein
MSAFVADRQCSSTSRHAWPHCKTLQSSTVRQAEKGGESVKASAEKPRKSNRPLGWKNLEKPGRPWA